MIFRSLKINFFISFSYARFLSSFFFPFIYFFIFEAQQAGIDKNLIEITWQTWRKSVEESSNEF